MSDLEGGTPQRKSFLLRLDAELYLELPSRRLIPYAFSGKPAPLKAQEEARQVIQRGIGAMQRLCRFSPWVAGPAMTLADIYVHYVDAVVNGIGARQLEWDILAEIPGMKEWDREMRDSDIARAVETDRRANEPDFHAYVSEYMAKASKPET